MPSNGILQIHISPGGHAFSDRPSHGPYIAIDGVHVPVLAMVPVAEKCAFFTADLRPLRKGLLFRVRKWRGHGRQVPASAVRRKSDHTTIVTIGSKPALMSLRIVPAKAAKRRWPIRMAVHHIVLLRKKDATDF